GRGDEAKVLGLELRTRFPGYYQTQLDIARELATGGDREKALRIVQGLLFRDAFHGSVLRAVISTMIDLLMEDGQIEAAAGWYSMWKEFEPDPEKLEPYAPLELLNAAAKFSEDSERRAARRQLLRRKKAEGNDAVGAGRRRQAKTGDNPGQEELF
ncbi:MAG: hypothetical protein Q8O00_02620, partial [Holophaga sp.]|nr:hypothetical protein [Holophaga sp.]